jgi:hypothetical protein
MNEKCLVAAADLIRDCRIAQVSNALKPHETQTLRWHEGQMRAFVGQTEPAILLFEGARTSREDPIGWNLHVDATTALLNKDKPLLLNARASLAAISPFLFRDAQGKPIRRSATVNPDRVAGSIKCLDRFYKDAYGCSARK